VVLSVVKDKKKVKTDERVRGELLILNDIVWAVTEGGDCMDPAVLEFQKSCHILTKQSFLYMYLELFQLEKNPPKQLQQEPVEINFF
jgi:hypothetical protein